MENTDIDVERKIIINGEEVSLEEFQTLRRDPKVMLKEISKGNYKTLERMYG